MSNFTAIAVHPLTGNREFAQYLDNGAAGYSVKFPDGYTYVESQVTQVIEYPKSPKPIEALDNLMQCAALNFAGMDYPALKRLTKESALPVTEVLAAFGQAERAKEALLRVEVPMDGERE